MFLIYELASVAAKFVIVLPFAFFFFPSRLIVDVWGAGPPRKRLTTLTLRSLARVQRLSGNPSTLSACPRPRTNPDPGQNPSSWPSVSGFSYSISCGYAKKMISTWNWTNPCTRESPRWNRHRSRPKSATRNGRDWTVKRFT